MDNGTPSGIDEKQRKRREPFRNSSHNTGTENPNMQHIVLMRRLPTNAPDQASVTWDASHLDVAEEGRGCHLDFYRKYLDVVYAYTYLPSPLYHKLVYTSCISFTSNTAYHMPLVVPCIPNSPLHCLSVCLSSILFTSLHLHAQDDDTGTHLPKTRLFIVTCLSSRTSTW